VKMRNRPSSCCHPLHSSSAQVARSHLPLVAVASFTPRFAGSRCTSPMYEVSTGLVVRVERLIVAVAPNTLIPDPVKLAAKIALFPPSSPVSGN